jgi:hypothetical protein
VAVTLWLWYVPPYAVAVGSCSLTISPKRPSLIRAYLEGEDMPVYDAPEDEDDHGPRQSFNFAPGYNGIVYRADTPDWGAGPRTHKNGDSEAEQEEIEPVEKTESQEIRYKLQTMKWGKPFPDSSISIPDSLVKA